MELGVDDEAHRRHLVLVVGDVCEADHPALTTTLLAAGFDAIAVETGAATLRLIAGGVEPCVVVIDVDLPDMEGRRLWQRLQELDARTRPAAVLASGGEPDGTPAGVVPIRPLLRKPAAIESLIEVIERYCPRRAASAVA